jgi:hypothetical protein
LLSGIFTISVGSIASFGRSILMIWGGVICIFATTVGACPLTGSTTSRAPPPPPPPCTRATGKVRGGGLILKSTGITIMVRSGVTTVRTFSASVKTKVMMTAWTTNEIALDVWSRLKVSGSIANMGREAASAGANPFEEYP